MTYEGYVRGMLERRRLASSLRIASVALSFTVALLYAYGVYFAFTRALLSGVFFLLLSGIPFAVLSVLRVLLSFPRPYEVYSLDMPKGRLRQGRSFPSRHAFSSFIIAGALLPVSYYLALAAALLGILISFFRVSLGYHFPRDVIAGSVLGLLSSLIGLAIFPI